MPHQDYFATINNMKGVIMSKTVVAIASTIATLACATPAFAGDFYVYGSAGQSDIGLGKSNLDGFLNNGLTNKGVTNLAPSSSVSNTDTGYKLGVGYQFNPYVAVEGAYVDLGKATYSYNATGTLGGANGTANATGDVKVSGVNFSVVGILPVNSDFNLFGKVGMLVGEAKANINGSASAGATSVTYNAGGTKSQSALSYGIGVSYNVTKQISLRAEYEEFDLKGIAATGDPKANLFSVGVGYKF